jgi:outer membrane protein OmpA-like peptidoglycan-associated protein
MVPGISLLKQRIMKRYFLLITLLAAMVCSHAQIKGILERAKQKAAKKADEKVDKTIDKTVDPSTGEKQETSEEAGKPDAGKQGSETMKAPSLKVYSKYDFVPGERIIVYEDFAQDAVGDFPDKWNTNSSAEIVTIESLQGKWLKISKQGVFMPEFIDTLPDNFTLEYDLLCDNPGRVWAFYSSLTALTDRDRPENWQSTDSRFSFTVAAYPDGNSSSAVERRKDGIGESAMSSATKQFSDKTQPVHVALWRQKERIRIYFNQEKVWDLPKALSQKAVYNSLVYWLQGTADEGSFYLGNLRLAVGIPDTRKKILEQNKWVTHGILFDVNSAAIKPESYGTLKEMATVLKEVPDLKVKIVGHTDSDGKDADNLELSKRRAAAVKSTLAKEFAIDETRMETDGKGESEPIDKNDSPAGKANNRRVEFIKL